MIGRLAHHYHRDDVLLICLLLGLSFSLPVLFWFALLSFVLSYPWLPILWRANHRWLIGVGLMTGLSLAWFTLPNLFSGDSLLAVSALIAVLKRAEQQTQRDRLVLLVAVFISNILNLVYWSNLMALAHLLILIVLMLTLMRYEATPMQGVSRISQLTLLFWSIPLATLLFLFLPRIPGPLWDVGLAFGLPLSVYQQNLSILSIPGGAKQNDALSALQAQQQVVLVAEFASAVPLKSNLYWRGAVSYGYANGQWQDSLSGMKRSARLASAQRDMSHYQSLIKSTQASVSYQIKVAPNQQNWLYAPGLAQHNVQESFISADNQLLSIRPLHDEFHYSGSSFLNASFKADAVPDIKLSDLPEAERAQIEQLVAQWHLKLTEDKPKQGLTQEHAIKQQLLMLLANPPKWLDVAAPYNAQRLQRWVGISMLLMQRAGLPARMVSGYRGGDLIALSNVMVVRQKHRHHWLELWDSELGWQRLEIKDIVQLQKQPDRKMDIKASAAVAQENSAPKQMRDNNSSKEHSAEPVHSWLESLEQWLQAYTPKAIADPSSAQDGTSPSVSLQMWLPAMALVLWLLLLLIYRYYQQRPCVMEQSWQMLAQVLSQQGFSVQDWHCPSQLMAQLRAQQPPWEEAAVRLIQSYLHYHYAEQGSDIQPKSYRTQVKRLKQALKNTSFAAQSQPA